LPVISLFTGAGGLDIGFSQAGFTIRVCNDIDADSVKTLKKNEPNVPVLDGDIRKISTKQILDAAGLDVGEAALVIGGPPCQPFSKSGFWNPDRKGLKDPRAGMIGEFVRVVREAKPKAFIMENVHGLQYKMHKQVLDFAMNEFEKAGYTTSYKVVSAADYGVPQKRVRLIVVGSRKGKKFKFPAPSHANTKQATLGGSAKPHVTAGEALSGVNVPKAEKALLQVGGKWGALLPLIPPGDNYLYFTDKRGHPKPIFTWRSKYWSFLLKLDPDEPSWTIQAQPGPYVGPFHWENRRLSVAEIKRIQTFPDDWEFVGGKGSVQKQLGNAVPPLLAKCIAEAVEEQLFDNKGK
jgi:DNA (cytosine-5)-methyltransferase 1